MKVLSGTFLYIALLSLLGALAMVFIKPNQFEFSVYCFCLAIFFLAMSGGIMSLNQFIKTRSIKKMEED